MFGLRSKSIINMLVENYRNTQYTCVSVAFVAKLRSFQVSNLNQKGKHNEQIFRSASSPNRT